MFDNIHHLTGQRRFIRLILEKRVLRYSYFMIVEILGKKIQPCGLVICYEMNLVAVIGKRFSQLGGDHSAATKCSIRSKERRVWKECVGTVRSRWTPLH